MKNLIILISLLLFASLIARPQDETQQEEWFEDGEFFFERDDFEEALYYYQQLYNSDTTNTNAAYKIGMCYLEIDGAKTKAIPYFQQAITNMTAKYMPKSFKEKEAPYHAMFYLGNAYRLNNQLDKALEIYDRFILVPGFYETYNIRIVEEEVKACKRANIIQDSPVEIETVNLGPPINNESDNYRAVVSGDESRMVYMNEKKFYEAIYFAERINGKWSEPVNITPQVGSDGETTPTAISWDGTTLYLVKNNKRDKDIYFSKFINNRWTKMEPLNSNINSRKDETHASLSKDGKTLYFTSDRWGGKGGLDIYVSHRDSIHVEDWGEAVNMGDIINTEQDEDTPFECDDGKKLFFSSKGHFNMGDYDIFYCLKNDEGQWIETYNAGFPINTTGNNLFFQPLNDCKSAYYTLNREDGMGKGDIYKVKIIKDNRIQFSAFLK
jgi:tetratricopeptide (TPR) repeat protein